MIAVSFAGATPAGADDVRPVVVGSTRFTESYVLGEIVTQTLIAAGRPALHKQGLGNTGILEQALASGAVYIYPEYTGTIVRELLKREGILAGSSTGTLLAAALRHCRAQTSPKRVVTFVCDTGTRYLSKVYNDSWMFDQGLLHRSTVGDLRDLISRRVVDEAVISVTPDDTLLTAFQRMRAADISQLPVLQDGKLAGLLDESDLLLHVSGDSERFRQPVRQAMNRQLRTLRPDAGLPALITTLGEGWVAVVADADGFYGLITRFDLLNYLRKTLA